jgi:hypothetical protein
MLLDIDVFYYLHHKWLNVKIFSQLTFKIYIFAGDWIFTLGANIVVTLLI